MKDPFLMPSHSLRLRALVGDHTTSRLPMGVTRLRPSFADARAFGADPLVFLRGRVGERDACRLHLGFTEFVFVSAPDLVKRVLVSEDHRFGEGKWTQRGEYLLGDCIITREGAPHAERRRLVQPAFRDFSSGISEEQVKEIVEARTAAWRDGDLLEMRTEMARMALAVSSVFLFGEDPQRIHPLIFEDLWAVNSRLSSPPLPVKSVKRAIGRLRQTARQMRGGRLVRQLRDAHLSEEAVDREIIALMLASIDTTPGTVSWIWTLLDQHPGVSDRLVRELAGLCGDAFPTADVLAQSASLKNIMMEALRLHPPVRFVDRRALEDIKLGGETVRSGEYILLSPLLNHRDPRYWQHPDEFAPERWVDGGRASFDRFSYFPFGAGPHACIGGAVAQRIISLLLAVLAPRWRFRTAGAAPNPHLVPPRFDMTVEART